MRKHDEIVALTILGIFVDIFVVTVLSLGDHTNSTEHVARRAAVHRSCERDIENISAVFK